MPPRLASEIQFPPYSYVTGQFPHPFRHPAGHSYGHQPALARPLDPARWNESPEYRYAIDLFNHGYYWEAHEAWESLWHACGRKGATADFLKGLIKLAAAGVKAREGRVEGVRRHATRALELFTAVRATIDQENYCGLDIALLSEVTRGLIENPPILAPSTALVETVFHFFLVPMPASA